MSLLIVSVLFLPFESNASYSFFLPHCTGQTECSVEWTKGSEHDASFTVRGNTFSFAVVVLAVGFSTDTFSRLEEVLFCSWLAEKFSHK